MCTIDSLIQRTGGIKIIAGGWSDYEGYCQYYSEFTDSIIYKKSSLSFDELPEEMRRKDGAMSFENNEKIVINKNGEFVTVNVDTLNVKC